MSSDLGIGPGSGEREGVVALGIGGLTALIIGAAALVVGIIPWQHLGIALVSLVVVLALGFAYARSLVGSVVGPRGPLIAALTMVGFAPVVGQAALRTLYAPLGGPFEQTAAEAVGMVVAALCSFSLASVIAFWWGSSGQHGARILRVAAWSSVIMCCGLALVAAQRAAPPADRYAAALPLAAELLPEPDPISAFAERRPGVGELSPTGFALGRSCLGNRCFVHVRNATRVRTIGPRVARAASLSLRHDAVAGIVLLLADTEVVASMDASLAAWDWVLPSAAAVALRVSAPRSFLALAWLALAAAAVALLWRRRLSSQRATLASGRVGHADPNGWARLEDGSPLRLTRPLAPGPIVISDQTEVLTMAYRGPVRDQAFTVHPGARGALLERVELSIAAADAVTFSLVLALSAPLLAAAALGLL